MIKEKVRDISWRKIIALMLSGSILFSSVASATSTMSGNRDHFQKLVTQYIANLENQKNRTDDIQLKNNLAEVLEIIENRFVFIGLGAKNGKEYAKLKYNGEKKGIRFIVILEFLFLI